MLTAPRLWMQPAAISLFLFSLYAGSAPRTVAFEDDGLFLMAGEFLGIAHPPGYPLYVLLAKLSMLVPVGSMAYRVHLLSGLLGAATCAVVWWIARSVTSRSGAACLAALAYGVSPVLWSQSIVAEAYTLNTLLFFTLVALMMRTCETRSPALLPAIGLIYGLSLANHYPLMLLATPCLVGIGWPVRGLVLQRAPVLLAGVLLGGLVPYLGLFLRSRMDPVFSFYGPLRDLDELVYFIARRGYAALDNSPLADWSDRIRFWGFLSREALWQYTPLGALVALVGFLHQLRSARHSWNLALLAGFVSGGFAVALLRAMEYQFLQQMIFRVYPLIPYGILAIWLAAGLAVIADATERRGIRGAEIVLGLGVVGTLLALHLPANDRHHETFARDLAQGVLESLERDAILFTDTDADALPIGYLNLVEGVRPDVDVYHYQGLLFSTRLMHALDGTPELRLQRTRELIRETERPIYFMRQRDLGYGLVDYGFYGKVDRSQPRGSVRARVDPALHALALRLLDEDQIRDPWSRLKRESVLANYVRALLGRLHEHPADPQSGELRESLERMTRLFLPAFARVFAEKQLGTKDDAELLADLRAIEGKMNATTPNKQRAYFHATQGALLVSLGRDDEAIESLRRSLAIRPEWSGTAYLELLRVYARTGRIDEYRALRSVLPEGAFLPGLGSLDREAGL